MELESQKENRLAPPQNSLDEELILFPRNPGQEKSEADLMLALNEALQQVGEDTWVRFTQVHMLRLEQSLLFLPIKQMRDS